jgi:hypothetical protein
MADGYGSHDRRQGCTVAICVVAPAFKRARGFVERFGRGSRVAAHPG